jgi:CHAT domain-containing protein
MQSLSCRIPGTICAVLALACYTDSGSGRAGQALSSGEAANGDSAGLEALVERGTELYRRAEFDSVMALVGVALEEARALSDSSAIARLLVLDGYVAYQHSDYDKALDRGEEALAIELAIDLSNELAQAYNLLGLIAWQQSRLGDAIELFDKTAETAGDGGDGGTKAAINLGNVHTELGNLAEARAAFERGLELSRLGGNENLQGIALNNLGMLSIRVGDPLGAIPLLEDANAIFRARGAANYETNTLGQFGTAYTALGEIRKAIAVLDSALQLARSKGMRQEEASNLEALAEAYRAAGDHRRALALYAEAEAINRETGLVSESGSDKRSRAQIYEEMGEIAGSLQAAEDALETHRSVGARWEEFADLLLLADLSQQLGNGGGSRVYLDRASELAVAFDARTSRVELALTEARIAERSGDPRQVLEALDRVETDLSTGAYDWVWAVEVLRARAYAALGDFDSAAAAGSTSVRAVERVRAGFGSGFLRSRITSDRREAYASLVEILLDMGDTLAAFEISDAARGRSLLEHITVATGVRPGDIGEAVHLERARLLRQINEWNGAISYQESFLDDRDDAALRDLTERIAKAQAEYEALRVLAIERDTTAAALLGERKANVQQVQRALQDDEVLLEYLVTDDRVVIFAVTRSTVRSFAHVVAKDDLWRRVRIARDLISDPSWDVRLESTVLSSLHETLVAPPGEALRDARRLIIVPDGVLNYLPFSTLTIASTGRYLVEDYAIQVLPSASGLPALRARSQSQHFDTESGTGTAFAPFSRSLPATQREVEAFRRNLPSSKAITGRKATETRLREALSQTGIVHVATHGVLNVRNPMFSRLEMAGRSDDDIENDGRLEVHELFGLQAQSPLVFLSGCETGLGVAGSTSFAAGEDYATLAQAFLYGGAQNVVSTLWRVEDEGAAAFAELFYRGLKESSPAEALAKAQRQMIISERYGAPYYWAAYQLTGEGRGGSQLWTRRSGVQQR